MTTLAERVLEALVATDTPMDDDQLAYVLGADRHHINSVCRKLKSEGRVLRARLVGNKIVNVLVSGAVPSPAPDVPVTSGRQFEVHARAVLTERWGIALPSQVLTLDGGVTHSFDLVSPDATIVGDAKWYKDLQPVPAAKLSVIGEYVWLLGHVQRVRRRFLVFGQDRAVPMRWLARFKPLLGGVEFWFLEGDELEQLA